jgi:hypothetical protein
MYFLLNFVKCTIYEQYLLIKFQKQIDHCPEQFSASSMKMLLQQRHSNNLPAWAPEVRPQSKTKLKTKFSSLSEAEAKELGEDFTNLVMKYGQFNIRSKVCSEAYQTMNVQH